MKRVSYNAGIFYPNNIKDLKLSIDRYNTQLEQREDINSILNIIPKAVISPQSKYIYCGYNINLAHRVLANSSVKRVVVIGHNHNVEFSGISGSFFQKYQTPIRKIDIDIEYLKIIETKFNLEFIQEAHFLEHSTEVQMPMIAHYQPNVKVIELIYGENCEQKLSEIITWLLQDSLTSVVICSDLSYLFTPEQTNYLDTICLSAIANADNNIFNKGCESCGLTGLKALNSAIKRLNMKNLILDYRTSIINENPKKVSGYTSVAYW